ncbi:hypothetical protein B0J15DRAFT_455379 [Fusarium solani]|uniref:BZIP domain-containing protein n=1 Tax=Fusarium solani TaxID=169388 RepID=A0A9P9JPQ1_FUSSL|nr:uncharacterized protein B0J15DRAFT_455379 [Fusarium solani]KAH7232423.1 hypothetical protein B0J15DRAFT_455379 [Fusarium solani]
MEDGSPFGIAYISQSLQWGQWWPVDESTPLHLSADTSSVANGVYTWAGPSLNGFAYNFHADSTDHCNDINPVTDFTSWWNGLDPTTEGTTPSLTSRHIVAKELPRVQGCGYPPSTTKNPSSKRNGDSDDLPTRKSAGQSLIGDGKLDPLAEKVKYSTTRAKRNATGTGNLSAPQCIDQIKRTQERNRIASTKFRIKKREDISSLEPKKQDLERIHRNLSTCVADLTFEVYKLKMQLLQHSGCNCTLIQNYLVHESGHYIQTFEEKSQREASHWQL